MPLASSTNLNEATRAVDEGEYERALRLLYAEVRALKRTFGSNVELSRVYGTIGRAERIRGRPADAVRAYRECVRWDGSDASAWFALGECLMMSEAFEEAAKAFEEFVDRCDDAEKEKGETMIHSARLMMRGSETSPGETSHEERWVPPAPCDDDHELLRVVKKARDFMFTVFLSATSGIRRTMRQSGRLHPLPMSERRDLKRFAQMNIALLTLYRPLCSARGARRTNSVRECSELAAEFHVPNALTAELCDLYTRGYWFPVILVLANAFVFSMRKHFRTDWHVGPSATSRFRLIGYQFVHADETHLIGNMLTLLVICTEVIEAIGCSQVHFAVLYIFSGWCGGICAVVFGEKRSRHVGASGSISGAILALSVLRPTQAVRILGDIKLSNPLLAICGTLLADLSRERVSWEGHLGGGLAGVIFAGTYKLARMIW